MLIRSARDAERVACQWLQAHGYPDAQLTGRGADGGVDVDSSGAVAQVKAEVVPVGAPVVQQTFGIASARGVDALVFALAGFTAAATRFANSVGVALFTFDLQSEVEAINSAARALSNRESGFVLSEDQRRLIRRASELGITGLVAAEAPRAGLRATPERLAAWAAHVSASAGEGESDVDGWYSTVVLELGGGAPAWGPVGRLMLGAGTDDGVDGQPMLFVSTDGNQFGGKHRWLSMLPASQPGLFGQVVVGTAIEATSERAPGQLPFSLGHLRVIEEEFRSDYQWKRTVPAGDALVEDPRTEPFAEVEQILGQCGRVRLVAEPGRHWREARFQVREHAGARLVFAVVDNYWSTFFPGPGDILAALAYHLPEALDVLDDDLAKPALRDEQVIAAVVVPEGQTELALAVLVEALTLDPDDLSIS